MKGFIFKLVSALVDLLTFLFGSFHWILPQWLQKLKKKLSSLWTQIKREHQTRKKRFYCILSGLFFVAAIGAGAYHWYTNQPEPIRLSVNSSTIKPTPLKEGSKPETYKISFGGSAAKLSDVGKKITKGIVMSPKIEGSWEWTSGDTLMFTVSGDWPVGTIHRIQLKRDLFPSHVHLETYKLELSTPKFELHIQNVSFYQDPRGVKKKKVIAQVAFSHPVHPESFEKNVKLTYLIGGGKGRTIKTQDVDFKVTYDKFFGKAFVHSDNLSIPNYESQMKIEVAKGIHSKGQGQGSATKLERSITVPGILTLFRFKNAELKLVRNHQYESEQVLILHSTSQVSQKDLTKHLEVYSLPRDRPASFNRKEIKRYSWHVNAVSQKVLSLATKVKLTPIPTEKKYSQAVSYKYRQNPGMFLYIHIKKGLTSFGGYILPEGRSFVVRVPDFPKELEIMAEGALLSLAGEKKLSILARNMDHVRYRAQRLLPGQIAHFVTQSHKELGRFYNYQFGMENIAETFSQVRALPLVKPGKTQYSHFDFTKLLNQIQGQPKGLFYFTSEGWDHLHERQNGPRDHRFILITDIGIISKKSTDGSFDLFIQSISNGRPLPGAKVQVIGKNGLPVLTQTSNSDGHVWFSNLKNFQREKDPVAFVVTKGGDLSFLPIGMSPLNYSQFDVGGVHTQNREHRLESYIFSDRGIYRPGEKVSIGYIVKNPNWSDDLSGVNLELSVEDPKGSVIKNLKNFYPNPVGFETYQFETGITWPTGNYRVSLFVKRGKRDWERTKIGSVTVAVEEFVPDRLKIVANFSKPVRNGWLDPKDLKGLVNLKNLFGTPAQNRRVTGRISLRPSYPSFDLYKEWKFYDPMRSKQRFDEALGEKITNETGDVTFDLGLDKFESASYLLQFMAEGFEAEGGRSVLTSHAVLISHLKYLVGYKAQGDLNYIKRGAELGVNLMAIDSHLAKVAARVKLKTVEFRQVSTLVKQKNGTYKYESVKKEYEKGSSDLSIDPLGTLIPLDTSQPGDFALVLLNDDNLELNRVPYSVAGPANLAFKLEKNAELQVKLNKSTFNPGEEIEISIRSPYVGTGLITVERERTFSYKWFHTNKKSTLQKIKIPLVLEGNGYVNVMLVRSLSSNEIFMSPLSIGVAPFSINKLDRTHQIFLKTPPLVRPGENLNMEISSNRKGKAVVFAVDEGILQFARYKNPDPLSSFYKKRALEVKTTQMLDLILPEFSKFVLRRSSEGGGLSAAKGSLGKNLNPFRRQRDKVVAYWSGLIDIGPQSQRLTYSVPDYFSGQLRVIAVAVSQKAMGSIIEKTLVKGPFVISPNTPNFVSPGDQLKVSVGISNNVKGSGEKTAVEVRLKASENIKIESSPVVQLKIDEGSESSATFDILAQEPLGNANLVFTASYKKQSSQRTSTLSIRPAAPFIVSLQSGYVDAHQNLKVTTPRKTYKKFQSNEVSVSRLPLGLAQSFVNYLQKYPYGCTEQVISRGFPSIILGEYKEWGKIKSQIASQVEGITEILTARQLPDGGFTKWPGPTGTNAFHTAYAVHYLTEARERGYRFSKPLMKRALIYLKNFSEQEPKNLPMARVQAYGAYLLARNEIISTKSLISLEKWLEGYKDESWFKDVMLLYMAGSYKIMRASRKAQRLLTRFDLASQMSTDYEYGIYDDTIKRAMHLYLVSKHFPEKLREFDGENLKILVDQLSKRYNTTSSSLSILSFEAYAHKVNKVKGNHPNDGIAVTEWLEKSQNIKEKNVLRLTGSLFPKSDFSPNANKIDISNNTDYVTYFSVLQEGFDKKVSQTRLSNGIEVLREFLDAQGNVIKQGKNTDGHVARIKIGDEITVRLRSRSINDPSINDPNDLWTPNVVIVDLLPGGFEVVLSSINRVHSRVVNVDNPQIQTITGTSPTATGSTTSLQTASQTTPRDISHVEYVDVREDRVLIFSHFGKDVQTYEYKIKAINKGQYQVPPIFSESMYDRRLQAKGITGEIIVE